MAESPDIPPSFTIPEDIQKYSKMALWHDPEDTTRQALEIKK